jgi:hypothetical protein
MTLPLYQDLIKNVTEVELTSEEKENIIKKIKKLDILGHELIYALIRCYQLENETNYGTPYDGKVIQKGLKFDLEKFPPQLKNLINSFIDIHLEKMKEEIKLNKNRKK